MYALEALLRAIEAGVTPVQSFSYSGAATPCARPFLVTNGWPDPRIR